MVRSFGERTYLPAKSVLEEGGDMMILTGKTLVSAVRPPYIYGGEFVQQFLFAVRLCWFPLLLSTIPFGYARPGPAAVFPVLLPPPPLGSAAPGRRGATTRALFG